MSSTDPSPHPDRSMDPVPGEPTPSAAPPSFGPRQDLGRIGETWAANYLRSHGAVVLERNWRARPSVHGMAGELDLVLLIGTRLVAAEVKTRSGTGFGHPFEAVTPAKLRRLHLLLSAWAREHGEETRRRRVDAVAVLVRTEGTCDPVVRIEHRPGLA